MPLQVRLHSCSCCCALLCNVSPSEPKKPPSSRKNRHAAWAGGGGGLHLDAGAEQPANTINSKKIKTRKKNCQQTRSVPPQSNCYPFLNMALGGSLAGRAVEPPYVVPLAVWAGSVCTMAAHTGSRVPQEEGREANPFRTKEKQYQLHKEQAMRHRYAAMRRVRPSGVAENINAEGASYGAGSWSASPQTCRTCLT
jgi:hypothetical protein